MAEPSFSGYVSLLTSDPAPPLDGSKDVTFKSQGKYTIAPSTVRDCRITNELKLRNMTTCDPEKFAKSTSTDKSNFSQPVSGDTGIATVELSKNSAKGYYRATCILTGEYKKDDGSWSAPETFATTTKLFGYRSPTDSIPYAFFCRGKDSPAAPCLGTDTESPKDGSSFKYDGKLIQVGASCVCARTSVARKVTFDVTLTAWNPTGTKSFVKKTVDIAKGGATLEVRQVVATEIDAKSAIPGRYTAQAIVVGSRPRLSSSAPVNCNEFPAVLDILNWSFTVTPAASSGQ